MAGEQFVERYLADGKPADHFLIAVLRVLLVQTWKPITDDLEHPVVGWVLGTLFPHSDVPARHRQLEGAAHARAASVRSAACQNAAILETSRQVAKARSRAARRKSAVAVSG